MVAAMAICPLLAARWEPQVAVASALRWLSAGFFAVASVAFGLFQRGVPLAPPVSKSASTGRAGGTHLFADAARPLLRDLLVAFVVLVYVAMGAYVAQAALCARTLRATFRSFGRGRWCGHWSSASSD